MSRSKDAWLNGSGDLEEADVEDVPTKGQSVRVRALPAAFSSRAESQATELKTDGKGNSIIAINKERMEVLQFAHGVIDPSFSEQEAQKIAETHARAFFKVIEKIDELSAIDKEAIEKAQARFPDGDTETPAEAHANGGTPAASTGSDGPAVSVRAGAGDGEVG